MSKWQFRRQVFDNCTAECKVWQVGRQIGLHHVLLAATSVCALETLPEKTFPKIVAALPARHAAPLSVANFDDSWLPLTLMHRAPHAHRRREVACSPNWLWLLRWWRLGGWWRAQDVVTAPARMSAQPNLPTSVRATLQFGPIYLATGGGRSSRDSSGAVVKSVGCRHGQQET